MAGIITNSIRRGGATCDHRDTTVVLDGESFTFLMEEGILDEMPYGDPEKLMLIKLNMKRKRVLGLVLDNAAGCVCIGEEATNVKQYTILSAPVTKTNIGTAYVNILPGLNGERSLIEFTGCTQFRIVLHANLVLTGPFQVRLVRDLDTVVIFESASLTLTGERELDSDWQPIPASASGLMLVRLQGKSATAADDPIFRRCIVLVK